MKDMCTDLSAEYAELAALADTLSAEQWRMDTAFYGWTSWDEIAHLSYFDETSLLAVSDAAAFAADAAELGQALAQGREISAIARERYGHLDGAQLLAHWRGRSAALCAALAGLEAKARLPWYGPTMSARSFATARLMETWAHGQDVFDALRRPRQPTKRLKHIAQLGVATFAWSFVNRRLPVPEQPPHVELVAPDGEIWRWNPPSAEAYVKGSAEDFCLVVTQRRHLADTGLKLAGEAAPRWLAIAQCFAGAAADGPAPGLRKIAP